MFCFFFNDTATTEIYTLSLHDALPIYLWTGEYRDSAKARLDSLEAGGKDLRALAEHADRGGQYARAVLLDTLGYADRKSTRLNSSHANISYAVFCLKKKNILYV